MKKPEFNVPGIPHDADAIPLWLDPDLWDLSKPISYRRTKIVIFYSLSMFGFAALVALRLYIWLGITEGFGSATALYGWIVVGAMAVPSVLCLDLECCGISRKQSAKWMPMRRPNPMNRKRPESEIRSEFSLIKPSLINPGYRCLLVPRSTTRF